MNKIISRNLAFSIGNQWTNTLTPPELHLAMQLWQAYYEYDFPKNVTEFSDRLSIVARQLGIATSGNLYDRLKTLLNPLNQKQSSPALLDILKAIPAIDTDKLDN